MKNIVKAFKALSDDTRLRIMNILMQRECCVCEVIQALDISQTRASRNLTILHDTGFLKMRKDGLWSLYSIDSKAMEKNFPGLLDSLSRQLNDSEGIDIDRQRLAVAVRTGPGCCIKNKKISPV